MNVAVWAPPLRRPALVLTTVERVELPPAPENFTYKVRFHGQRTYIRATRLQAEQALASNLGHVIGERVVEKQTTTIEGGD